jgi:hypothetical protein
VPVHTNALHTVAAGDPTAFRVIFLRNPPSVASAVNTKNEFAPVPSNAVFALGPRTAPPTCMSGVLGKIGDVLAAI